MRYAVLILLLIATLALFIGLYYGIPWLGRMVRRQLNRHRDRRARWEWYSQPCGSNACDWEVGIRRTTSSGTVNLRVHRWYNRTPLITERVPVEAIAMGKAIDYNAKLLDDPD